MAKSSGGGGRGGGDSNGNGIGKLAVSASTLGNFDKNATLEDGSSISTLKNSVAGMAQDAYERVGKNWDKPGVAQHSRQLVEDVIAKSFREKYGGNAVNVFTKNSRGQKAMTTIGRSHLDDVARVVNNRLMLDHK